MGYIGWTSRKMVPEAQIMGSDGIAKTPVSPLRQLCDRAKLSDEAKALLTDELATKEFMALLVEKELFPDALRLVAYLLPKREAVGWGCLCVRHILASQPDNPLPEVHVTAERWVSAPNEENRWVPRKRRIRKSPRPPPACWPWPPFSRVPAWRPPTCKPCRRPTI